MPQIPEILSLGAAGLSTGALLDPCCSSLGARAGNPQALGKEQNRETPAE